MIVGPPPTAGPRAVDSLIRPWIRWRGKKLFHVKIGMLGRTWSCLPINYHLGDLKHLKNNSVLMENEFNQQRNENIQFKIRLVAEHQDL